MKSNKLFYLTQAILLTILFAGCAKPLEKAAIGTWQDKNHPGEFTVFRPDHTLTLVTPADSVTGKWEKISNNHLRLDLGVKFLHLEKIKISGDQMKFECEGIESTLLRQK